MLKGLPIGIQSITEVIEGGYVYIDKTPFVKTLLTKGKFYFVARPRRFGKTLFVSTLEEILRGNKELFKECFIYDSEYDWIEYPVIRFDFNGIPSSTPKILREALTRHLLETAKTYKVEIDVPTIEEGFLSLIRILSEKYNKVAILVDEYDKPIIDHLKQFEIAEKNRELLKLFFSTLKSVDSSLKLVFVTGIAKFGQTSSFSGFNNLKNLTTRADFSTTFGYTEEEIHLYLSKHIDQIVKQKKEEGEDSSSAEILDTMKTWYNGYKFSHKGKPVYNPHSTLSYLDEGEARSFWFETGTPSFLIDQIKKSSVDSLDFSGIVENEDVLMNIFDIDDMDINTLMWQTGYLSIQSYDRVQRLYTLDFPNKEVRTAFYNSLLSSLAGKRLSSVSQYYLECRSALEGLQLDAFFKVMISLYAKVPYNLYDKTNEGFYHALFLSFLEGMGLPTKPEEKTNNGQIDLSIELPTVIYIFEFKVMQSAKSALAQIKTKKYEEKYRCSGKQLALVGVNFDSKSRTISDYKGEVYSPKGETIAFSK